MNEPFLLSLCTILFGYFLKRIGFLKAEDSHLFSRIVMNITFPAVVLVSFTTAPLRSELFLVPWIPVVSGLGGLGMAYLFFRKQPEKLKGLMYMGAIGCNLGMFALPMIRRLYGDLGIQVAALIDFSNAFMVLGLAYVIGDRLSPLKDKGKRASTETLKVIFTSVPMVVYIIAFTMNISGLTFPSFVHSWLAIAGQANQFFVLMVLGLVLNFDWRHHLSGGLLPLLLIRYGIALVLVAGVWLLLPVEEVLRKIICLCIVLPTPFSIVPFSIKFGYDRDIAGAAMNVTSVISFFLMWGLVIIL